VPHSWRRHCTFVTGKCLSECYVDSVSVIRFIPLVFHTEPCRLLLQFLITAITADVFLPVEYNLYKIGLLGCLLLDRELKLNRCTVV